MADTHPVTFNRVPETANFGDRLTHARKAAGLSEADVARRLGVKTKTIRAWEAEETAPRANRLSILCGMLNVSLVWLMSGLGDGHGAEPSDAVPLPSDSDLLVEVALLRRLASDLTDRLAMMENTLRVRAEVRT